MFTACFVITEKCNLDCDYCYMNNCDIFMQPEVFDFHYEKTLPQFMKHYGEDKYYLDLFGGEPCLNWGLVDHIVKKVRGDENLEAVRLMTNGLLIDETHALFIKQNNIKLSLSFDGLWAKNLKQYKNKKKLFKTMVDDCSVCVTPQNMNMADNYKFLIEEFNLVPKFKIVRDNIWSDEDVHLFKSELDKLEEIYFDYLREGNNLIPKLFEHRLLMLIEGTIHKMDKMRCFVGKNGVAFSPLGKVYPCARFMTSDFLPLFDGKNILEENLKLIDEFANKFSNECKKCEISECCDHICLQQEFLNQGVIKNVCEIYKLVTNKVIRINHKLKENDIWTSYVKNKYRGIMNG